VNKQRVLFLCTHNSARSQMAEGFLRAMAGDRFEAQSAGTEKTVVHPLATRAMAERGIDIRQHTSKLYVGLMGLPHHGLRRRQRAVPHHPRFSEATPLAP
jgi:arsenate reductase (thioredoxin)